jgi:hypothetical protein
MNGSISTILESLARGLIETKINTRDLLKCIFEVSSTVISGILTFLFFIFIKVPLANLILGIVTAISWVITTLSYYFEYPYLKKYSFSPQYLLNLVKITEYDLTLLNYEINLWNQLKD